MPFDRAAHRKQAARLVEYRAGGEVLLTLNGKGDEFAATIQAERPTPTQANQDVGRRSFELVTIAREARNARGELLFASKLPREGEHFVDRAGRRYRIAEDRSVSHGAVLVFACEASDSLL